MSAPICRTLRAIRRNDSGFNSSLHVCSLLNSSKIQLHYKFPKWVYLLMSTFARSHQNDSPKFRRTWNKLSRKPRLMLISCVGLFIKFSFWILNFFSIGYWCSFGKKIKRGNLQSLFLAFLYHVLLNTVSDHAMSHVALQKSISYTAHLSHRGHCF